MMESGRFSRARTNIYTIMTEKHLSSFQLPTYTYKMFPCKQAINGLNSTHLCCKAILVSRHHGAWKVNYLDFILGVMDLRRSFTVIPDETDCFILKLFNILWGLKPHHLSQTDTPSNIFWNNYMSLLYVSCRGTSYRDEHQSLARAWSKAPLHLQLLTRAKVSRLIISLTLNT